MSYKPQVLTLIAATLIAAQAFAAPAPAAVNPAPAAAAPAPAAATPAPAKAAAPTIIQMSMVVNNLQASGYNVISSIELDKKVFKAVTYTPQGIEVKVLMNAETGETLDPKQNPAPALSVAEMVKRVEGSGYHDISEFSYNGSKYVVHAIDQKSKKVKLKIDGATGEISTAWF
jgi:hypothetical protein